MMTDEERAAEHAAALAHAEAMLAAIMRARRSTGVARCLRQVGRAGERVVWTTLLLQGLPTPGDRRGLAAWALARSAKDALYRLSEAARVEDADLLAAAARGHIDVLQRTLDALYAPAAQMMSEGSGARRP